MFYELAEGREGTTRKVIYISRYSLA